MTFDNIFYTFWAEFDSSVTKKRGHRMPCEPVMLDIQQQHIQRGH